MSASAAPSCASKTFTLTDLKSNSTNKSLFMLLHDKVYDVTGFLDEHPGGDEVLLSEAGRDATEAFEDVGHSDEARALLVPMLLGDFVGIKSERKVHARTATRSGSASSSSASIVLPIVVVGAGYLVWKLYIA